MKRLCESVEISRSSFYAWEQAAPARAERAAADAELADRIRAVHAEDAAYGAPRVTAELNDGVPFQERVNRKRVARVMREHGLAGLRLRRRVRTTVPEPADEKVPDLLKRHFTAPAPNQRYVGDITYLPIANGTNLYLATVIDWHSRRLTGWAIADHMRTSLVEDPLREARASAAASRARCHPQQPASQEPGMAHTCRGLPRAANLPGTGRCCIDPLNLPSTRPRTSPSSASNSASPSRWARSVPADNALAEAFNATLKRETLTRAAAWPDQGSCRRAIFRWANRYNTRRRHSYCGYKAPIDYEDHPAATLTQAA